jgi:hypothetical protein
VCVYVCVCMSCVLGWVGLDVRRAKGIFKKVDENHRDRLISELGSTKRRDRTDRESRVLVHRWEIPRERSVSR